LNPALTPGFDILGLQPSADPWVHWVTLGEIGWKPGAGGGLEVPELPKIAKYRRKVKPQRHADGYRRLRTVGWPEIKKEESPQISLKNADQERRRKVNR